MFIKRWWDDFTGLGTPGALQDPRETSTRAILFLLAFFVILLTPLISLGVAIGWFEAFSLGIMLALVATTGVAIVLTKVGWWTIARFLPPLMFFSLGVYGVATTSLTSTYLLFFVLTILVAFLVFEARASWFVFVISLIAPLVVSMVSESPSPNFLEILPSAIVIVATFGSIAFLQRFTARQANANAAMLSEANRALEAEIAEHARSEAALKESEARYRTLAEAAQDSIFIIDRQFRVAYVNSYGAGQFGYQPEQMIGRPMKGFFSPEVAARQEEALAGVFEQGEPLITESQSGYGDREVWLSTQLVPLFDGSGEVEAVLGMARDVTKNVQSERRLQLQGSALDAAANAILITNANGFIEWANPAFTTLTGYPLEEVLGKTPNVLNSGRQPKEFFKTLWETILSGRVWHGELENRRKNGELYCEEQTITPVLDDSGKITHFIAIKQDVTDRRRAEEELIEREAFNQAIITSVGEGVIVYDTEQRYRLWNWFMEELSGLPAEQVLGEYAGDLFPFLQKQGVDKLIQRALAGEIVHSGDLQYNIPATGKSGWYEATYSPLTGANGSTTGVVATVRDTTERKRVEEALQESEERFRTLSESALSGIYLIQDGCFRYVNPALAEGFGYTVEEVIDKLGPQDLTYPDDRPTVADNIRRRVEGEVRSIRYEFRGLRKDGSTLLVEVYGTRIDYQGKPAVIGTLIDVTERKRAEEALRENETRFRSLVENSSDEVSIVDADGSLLYESPSTNPLLGYQPGEFLGKSLFRLVHPDDLGRVQDQFARLAQNAGLHPRLQFRLRHHDGSWRWVEAVGTNLLDEPSVGGIVVNYHDITDRKLAEEHIQRQFTRLAALHNIQIAISSSLDLKITLQVLVEQITQQLKMDAATIFLASAFNTLQCVAARGFNTRSMVGESVSFGQPLVGQVAFQRQVVSIPDVRQPHEPFSLRFNQMLEDEGFQAYYGIPLIAKGEMKGVLEIFHRQPHSDDREWLEFLNTLGNQASTAIDNVGLFDDLQRSNVDLIRAYDSTLEGWSRALELRDNETGGHTQRVTDLCLRLAEALGLRGEELIHIRRGALIHDIGKMGVSDEILNKPGPLTEQEWDVMHMHPTYAYEMLSPIRFLRPALDIPHYHHEKWDGSGYPAGLKGEQIPIAARIFAVVDVWDALRSDRPYRKAWPKKKTLQYIEDNSGIHFDPQIVEKFIGLVK